MSSDATGGVSTVDAQTLVPRLAGPFDLTGDGKTILQGTYGHYAGKYNDVQFSRNSSVGNADRYVDAVHRAGGRGAWIRARLRPGELHDHRERHVPDGERVLRRRLRSPLTKEYTLALARELGQKGYVRATYVNRKANRLRRGLHHRRRRPDDDHAEWTARPRSTTSSTTTPTWRAASTRASTSSARIARGSSLTVNGNWTVQIENDGNFEGEAANNPAIPSVIGDYPEVYVADRSFPMGRLDDFQRHKVRVWAIYSLDLHQFGRLDVAPLYRYNSPRTFSLVAAAVALTPQQSAHQSRLRPAAREPAGLLRRARVAGVRRLRAVRSGRDLRRSGVAVAASVGEARSAEPVQQPAADLVGHDGHRRSRPDRRTPTACR